MAVSLLKLALLALTTLLAVANASELNAPYYNEEGILQIGTTELLNVTVARGADHVETVTHASAAYISVEFTNMDLPEGDLVIVRSPDSTDGYVYTGRGRGDLGSFVSSPIRGEIALVEYFALGSAKMETVATPDSVAAPAYYISGYVRGFQTQLESVCGSGDQTRPAKCFSGTPYTRARAVARLLIRGSSLCTGWLVGSSGHLMTNEHCITSAASAAQVDVEFMAESSSCSVQCATQLGCRGSIAATTSTFVANSASIDYALVKLPSSLAATYGYLQLRASGPAVGESIYIPQHPAGWAKRIADTVDGGASATIRFTGRDNTGCGNDQVGYLADTQGGSSGSPVLSQRDNLVVALHHCGGCDNLAVDVRTVLSDLARKGVSVPNISR